MEYVDSIFFRKINPSDFKKLYDLDIPHSGGGQTYLEAAGINNEDLVIFLSKGEISDSTLVNETRQVFTINSYVLGQNGDSSKIEFAPRGRRNNYRISRQSMRHKHPAWGVTNGFPEPLRNENGEYQSDPTFQGIIDNLIIIIIRTSYNKYFSSFISTETIPTEWPENVGLEAIFNGDRRGVLNLYIYKIPFINNKDNPFGLPEVTNIEEIRTSGGDNILLYGVPGAGKSWTIENEYCNDENRMERLVFHPDYTFSDFVGQILPKALDNTVNYKFIPGPFTTLLRKAYTNPDKEYFLVIEEINRGNAPAIFGEIFQLLDRKTVREQGDDGFPVGTSEYGITNTDIAEIVYGDPNHKVRIPSNMSIIGTMNTSDQNVFTLDTAFKRRWKMKAIRNTFRDDAHSNHVLCGTSLTWKQFAETINDKIIEYSENNLGNEDTRLGVYFLKDNEMDSIEIFSEKVLMYLWNDAFKFDHEIIFDMTTEFGGKKIKTLDNLVDAFASHKFAVFNSALNFETIAQPTGVEVDE